MDCLSNDSYRSLLSASELMGPAEVRDYFAGMCSPNVNIKCEGLTEDALLAIAQCERDVDLGIPVHPLCVARSHPTIVAAVATQCPEKAHRLDQFRAVLQPTSTASVAGGTKLALLAAGAAGFVALGYYLSGAVNK